MKSLAEKRAQAVKAGPMLESLPEPPQSPASHSSDVCAVRAAGDKPQAKEVSLVGTLAGQLHDFGVRQAFGVSGGAIALLFDALEESRVTLHHFRHETGAAFAATEAYFVNRQPTVVFATTGPGLLNTLTGMTAARWDGAKVILISGATSVAQRGRWATQETSSYTMPQDALFAKGRLFDYAVRMESATELPEVLRRVANGLARPGGFVAHICLPMSIQASRVQAEFQKPIQAAARPSAAADDVAECAELLKRDTFAIWCGFGASESALQVRELARRSGAKVFCSPRGKGVFPESHDQFLGVTGLGGHTRVVEYMEQGRPEHVLVLGSRLGEATSFWDRLMIPSGGFIHVDIDPEVPGSAYPNAETFGIHSDIGAFLDDLLTHFPAKLTSSLPLSGPWQQTIAADPESRSPVRPQRLMAAIQRHVVDDSDALVMAECGNSFAWCNHYLEFSDPGRYRVSTLFGSMGHAAAGSVGAALARRNKVLAVVGDGSMLMTSEISSAAQYQAPVVWVVLNDAGYGMCRDGHSALSLDNQQFDIPRVDFVRWARSMGGDGARVDNEDMLDVAFSQAMAATGPFVMDITIDGNETSPLLARFESLIEQGSSKNVQPNVAGWETQ